MSTDDLPERQRLAVYREVFGRSMLGVDAESLPGVPLHVDITLRALPGLKMYSGVQCGTRTRRTREMLADGNDDIGLALTLAGTRITSQRGRELTLGAGDAHLFSTAEIGTFTVPSGRSLGLSIPHAALAPLVTNVDDALMRLIPRGTEALRLLRRYVDILTDDQALATAELCHLVVTHIYDLVALAIGATRDATALVEGRGLRAAQLRSIKADIDANLVQRGLTVAAVAIRQRVSPRYIQMLFRSEATTFSDFVLGQRLARTHRVLTDLRSADRKISAIVFDNGFGDLSHFNRAFRRLYGASPSEVRAEAARREND